MSHSLSDRNNKAGSERDLAVFEVWRGQRLANWFVGIPVDGSAWLSLVSNPPECVKVVLVSDLHLTLAFLGAVDEARAQRAWESLRWPLPRLEVTLGRVVPMGDRRRPSALSAELELGRAEVALAMTACRDPMHDAAGVARETRAAYPHVTVAKPSRGATDIERQEAVLWATGLDLRAPKVSLARAALYTSATENAPARYRIVEERDLPI